MPGFASMNGVAIGEDGTVDPMQQLFRNSAVGVETGPFISQVRRSEASLCVARVLFMLRRRHLGRGMSPFISCYVRVCVVDSLSYRPTHPSLKPGHWCSIPLS